MASRKHPKKKRCSPDDIALKTFFLGPQAENIDQISEVFAHILYRWAQYRRSRFPEDGSAISAEDQTSTEFQRKRKRLAEELDSLISDFEDEIPKFSPRYLGHMFSEISLPALYGSLLALLHNPNNISEEASRVGLKIEREAIKSLSKMLGYGSKGYGHFTSCGTIANLEGAIRAQARVGTEKRLALFLPKHAHYSWEKIARTLGLSSDQIYWIELDRNGRLSADHLDAQIKSAIKRNESPFLAVSVFGTTEFGICDPVEHVRNVLDRWNKKGIKVWHHIDAAYGGFFSVFKSSSNSFLSKEVRKSLNALSKGHSITIDPHKLGYAPYASGAFLCQSRDLYQMPKWDSPYIAQDKKSPLVTFEGSRSAGGALAISLTARSLPFGANGFGKILQFGLRSRDALLHSLKSLKQVRILPSHDLNIVSFVVAKNGELTSKTSRKSLALYKKFSPENHAANYFITKTVLDQKRYYSMFQQFVSSWDACIDSDLTVVRLCLMNPFLMSTEPRVDYLKDFVERLMAAI